MNDHDDRTNGLLTDGIGIPGVAMDIPAGFEPVAGRDPAADDDVLADRRWLRRDGLYLAVVVTEPDQNSVAGLDESMARTMGRYHRDFGAEIEGVIPLTVAGSIGARGARALITSSAGGRQRLMVVAAMTPDHRVVTVQASWPDGVDLLDEAAAVCGSLTIG